MKVDFARCCLQKPAPEPEADKVRQELPEFAELSGVAKSEPRRKSHGRRRPANHFFKVSHSTEYDLEKYQLTLPASEITKATPESFTFGIE
jgi:hypothetical protein